MAHSEGKYRGTQIIVYGCERCTEILTFLDTHEILYKVVNIEDDLDASMLVADVNQGQFLMPAVQIGDDFYSLPTLEEIAKRLGVDLVSG